MDKENQERKQNVALKWIKSDTGNTYLCPVDALKKVGSHSDKELKKICVEESKNPQND